MFGESWIDANMRLWWSVEVVSGNIKYHDICVIFYLPNLVASKGLAIHYHLPNLETTVHQNFEGGKFYGEGEGRVLGAETPNHQLGRHHLLLHQDLKGGHPGEEM
tara:strand:- start:36 stop:350 length:315 start_codon:yes stop_codon:yes gene_type:complete